jgi:hypothetical protein
LAAIALLTLGWWLLPDTTPPHVVPGFLISADSSAVDTVSITYMEIHPRNNAIDAQVIPIFGKRAPAGSTLRIFIQLPSNVSYQSCEAADSSTRVRCFDAGLGGTEADVSFLRSNSGTVVIFHLSGPGLGFVESGGQVAAELPIMSDVEPGSYDYVDYRINDAAGYQWSGEQPRPTSLDADWSEPVTTMMKHQLAATGVRGDLQSHNSDLTFVAGVIIGTAGAALIAAGQARFKRSPSLT